MIPKRMNSKSKGLKENLGFKLKRSETNSTNKRKESTTNRVLLDSNRTSRLSTLKNDWIWISNTLN